MISKNIINWSKILLKRFPYIESVIRISKGNNYHEVNLNDVDSVAQKLSDAWKDSNIPRRQWTLVQEELSSYRKGQPIAHFDALVNILINNIPDLNEKSLIEIGCSTGYYSEVLRIKGIEVCYRGCDYSEAFIRLARDVYFETQFNVEGADDLSYGTESFDVVISGGCIMHVSDYESAIAEAARISMQYVIFHRTPVMHREGPVMNTKKAYGVEMIEIHFNEQKLVRIFSSNNLRIMDINTHSISWDMKHCDVLAMKTYLCEKVCKKDPS